MNIYRHRFTVKCPNNGVAVEYALEVMTARVVMVEAIIAACTVEQSFHEGLADALLVALGGRQVLRAYHHGVEIETVRGGL